VVLLIAFWVANLGDFPGAIAPLEVLQYIGWQGDVISLPGKMSWWPVLEAISFQGKPFCVLPTFWLSFMSCFLICVALSMLKAYKIVLES
jgi:hypothetical protein